MTKRERKYHINKKRKCKSLIYNGNGEPIDLFRKPIEILEFKFDFLKFNGPIRRDHSVDEFALLTQPARK